ncbi:MAG TPA: hypothetical protein PKO09_18330 [Anaerolineae bacterium]|nr:hypothetical protein [Anaerolineae bacterium]
MSTELSFGYLNALAVAEIVIDRLIGAMYDGQEIPDTHASEVSAGSVAHIFISRPRVSFDATRPGCNVVLTVDDFQILPPGLEEPLVRVLEVQFPLVVDWDTQTLQCDFSGLDTDTVTAVTPEGADDVIVATLVAYALREGGILGDLPFSFIGGSDELLGCDMLHVRILDDPSGDDRDTLNIGLWDYHGTEVGEPEDIAPFLEEGKQFTLRMSSTAFDQMAVDALDERFMCFDLTVPEEEQTVNDVRIVPPAAGMVTLEGQPNSGRIGVSGTIRNRSAADAESVSFRCDSEGGFTATLQADAGDCLEIRGTQVTLTFEDYSAVLYRPVIELRNGYVNLRAVLSVEDPVEVAASLDADIRLQVDPATGRLATSTEADVDLPWWADILLSCMGVSANGIVAGYADDEFGRLGANLVPELVSSEHLVVFWEDIEVREDGLILSGQIEAGRIVNAGRTTELSFGMGAGHQVTLNLETATLEVSGAMLADLGMTRTFEELDADSLAQRIYHETRATLPAAEHRDGRVFAVRAWPSFGKIRLNVLEDGRPLLRWVLYEPAILPQVELVGEWHQYPEPSIVTRSGFRLQSSGARRYWGEFTVELRQRLYDPEAGSGGEPDIHWETYRGPGDFAVLDGGRTVSIDIDTEAMEEESFEIDLAVEVTDIFGRSASAHRLLRGSKYCQWLIPPDREKEPHFRIPPREPVEVEIVTPDKEHEGKEKRVSIREAETAELERCYAESAQATVEIGEEIAARYGRSGSG